MIAEHAGRSSTAPATPRGWTETSFWSGVLGPRFHMDFCEITAVASARVREGRGNQIASRSSIDPVSLNAPRSVLPDFPHPTLGDREDRNGPRELLT
jgi:hypothetical protein